MKEQKNKKTEDAVLKSEKIKEAAITAVKAIEPEAAPEKKEILMNYQEKKEEQYRNLSKTIRMNLDIELIKKCHFSD